MVYHAEHCPLYHDKGKTDTSTNSPIVTSVDYPEGPEITPGEEHTPPHPPTSDSAVDRRTKRVREDSACSCGALSPEGNFKFEEGMLKEELKEESSPQEKDMNGEKGVNGVTERLSEVRVDDQKTEEEKRQEEEDEDVFGKNISCAAIKGAGDSFQNGHKVTTKPPVDITAASEVRESVVWAIGEGKEEGDALSKEGAGTDADKTDRNKVTAPYIPDMQIGNIMYYQYQDQSQGQKECQGQQEVEDVDPGITEDDLDSANLADDGSSKEGQKGIIKRTIGSISSIGSSIASSSPNFSTLVDFSSGLFAKNQQEPGVVKDVGDVEMNRVPTVVRLANHDVQREHELEEIIKKAPRRESGDAWIGEILVENMVKLDDKPELFRSLDGELCTCCSFTLYINKFFI